MTTTDWRNKLYFGDNLRILRESVPDDSVDLIYLDPTFNSNATYNVLFRERSGEDSAAQIIAFEDTWSWSVESEIAFQDVITDGPEKLGDLLQAMRGFLGQNDMMAYLTMMAQRMAELHRVLKPTGSIYLHCDPTASHYLKLMMDSVFGQNSFRNEIVWKRTSGHNDAQRYGRVHDVILYYACGPESMWNLTYQPYEDDYVARYYKYSDPDGRKWMSDNLSAAGLQGGGYEYEWRGITRVWRAPITTMERLDSEGRIYYTRNGIARRKRYLDEAKGNPVQDVWTDVQSLRGCFRSLRIDLYYAHYAQTLSQRSHRRTVGCSRSPAPTSQTWRTPSRSRPTGGGQRHPVRASERMRLAYAPQRSSSLANSVQILSEMDNGRNVETGQWDSALRRSRGGGQESDAQRGDHRQPVSEDY